MQVLEVNSAGYAFLKLDCLDFYIPVNYMRVQRCLSCDKYLNQVGRLYSRAYKAGFVLICSALGTYKVLET